MYIGRTVATSVSWEELSDLGLTEDERELLRALDRLVAFSLLEVTASGPVCYGLHPLTRQFINGELPDRWWGTRTERSRRHRPSLTLSRNPR